MHSLHLCSVHIITILTRRTHWFLILGTHNAYKYVFQWYTLYAANFWWQCIYTHTYIVSNRLKKNQKKKQLWTPGELPQKVRVLCYLCMNCGRAVSLPLCNVMMRKHINYYEYSYCNVRVKPQWKMSNYFDYLKTFFNLLCYLIADVFVIFCN